MAGAMDSRFRGNDGGAVGGMAGVWQLVGSRFRGNDGVGEWWWGRAGNLDWTEGKL